MDTMNVHKDSLVYVVDDPNLDQFIRDMICNFNTDLINDCFIDNQSLPCPPNPYDHHHNNNNANSLNVYDPVVNREEGENDNGGSTSSATTTTANKTVDAKPGAKTDRAKTLVSERRRRGRMKDKLYALRALVPNITKMDKASIIGDAVSYVHDLQAQAKKLKAEVAGLEASLSVSENYQGSITNNVPVTYNNYPIYKKIMQVEMVQVEERGYYTKIVSNKGEGVAASLYKALESLTDFNIQNSNLANVCDNYLLTFTLNVKGCETEIINLPNMKLWVAGALLNQGFEIMPSFQA